MINKCLFRHCSFCFSLISSSKDYGNRCSEGANRRMVWLYPECGLSQINPSRACPSPVKKPIKKIACGSSLSLFVVSNPDDLFHSEIGKNERKGEGGNKEKRGELSPEGELQPRL